MAELWKRKPTAQSEPDHDRQRQGISGQVGEGASGEHGGAGHGQAPEPIDDSALKILGQADGGGHAADQDGLDEYGGNDVVDVVASRDLYGAAEHVAEEQQQQRRLKRADEQQPGGAQDPQQVSLGHAGGVAERPRVESSLQVRDSGWSQADARSCGLSSFRAGRPRCARGRSWLGRCR